MTIRQEFAEAASFALYFSGSEAALSTPHLYISALATWPRDLGPCQGWKRHFPGIPGFTNASLGDRPLITFGAESSVTAVAFSSDDSRIVSGSADKSVRVWDASTGEMLKVLEGHTRDIRSVAFSSDDSHIVSGSDDQSVRVWDASMGETLEVLEGHTEPAAFSVNGRCVVADKSVPTQWTSLRYIRQKIAESSGYPSHTGWLLSPQGEHYLMFVPLTAQLPDSSNILTLPPSYAASVDFTSSALGSEWCNCFSP